MLDGVINQLITFGGPTLYQAMIPHRGGYEKNIEKPSDNQLVMAMENPHYKPLLTRYIYQGINH